MEKNNRRPREVRNINIAGMRKYSRRGYIERHAEMMRVPSTRSVYTRNEANQIVDYYGAPLPDRNSAEAIRLEHDILEAYLMQSVKNRDDFIFIGGMADTETAPADVESPAWLNLRYKRTQPMLSDCRVSVMIPARFEAGRIMHTLNGLANQRGRGITPDMYEINVLNSVQFGEHSDETTELLYRFAEDHPELVVNFWDAEVHANYDTVGRKRKMLADITIDRAMSREHYNNALYFIPTDADEIDVDPYWVAKVIDRMDADPSIDILSGHHERLDPELFDNDLAVLYYRGVQIIRMLAKAKELQDPQRDGYNWVWNRIISGNGPVAMSALAYAMVGGYDPNLRSGEDMIMGEMVSVARGNLDPSGQMLIPNLDTVRSIPVNVRSNFIRFGTYLITQTPPYEEQEFTKPKDITHEQILDAIAQFRRIDPSNRLNIRRFENLVQEQVEALGKLVGRQSLLRQRYLPRFMNLLGFSPDDYNYSNGNVVIRTWQGMQNKLAGERDRGFRVQQAWDVANSHYDERQRELFDRMPHVRLVKRPDGTLDWVDE